MWAIWMIWITKESIFQIYELSSSNPGISIPFDAALMQDFLWTSFIPLLTVRKNTEIWISFNSSKLLWILIFLLLFCSFAQFLSCHPCLCLISLLPLAASLNPNHPHVPSQNRTAPTPTACVFKPTPPPCLSSVKACTVAPCVLLWFWFVGLRLDIMSVLQNIANTTGERDKGHSTEAKYAHPFLLRRNLRPQRPSITPTVKTTTFKKKKKA